MVSTRTEGFSLVSPTLEGTKGSYLSRATYRNRFGRCEQRSISENAQLASSFFSNFMIFR